MEEQFCYSFSVCYSQKPLPSLKMVDSKDGGMYEISEMRESALVNMSLQRELLYSLMREGIQRDRLVGGGLG